MTMDNSTGDFGSNPLMTVAEAADSLRFHPSTVYRLVKRGHLPAAKIGRQWRISREGIDRITGSRAVSEPPPEGDLPQFVSATGGDVDLVRNPAQANGDGSRVNIVSGAAERLDPTTPLLGSNSFD